MQQDGARDSRADQVAEEGADDEDGSHDDPSVAPPVDQPDPVDDTTTGTDWFDV